MEKVEFENERGLKLVGNYWKADSDAGIVMAHGFGGNREEHGKFVEIAEALNEAGFNLLTFDFSGCGESDEDSITIEKEIEDLNSAVDFVRSRGVEDLGLIGISQGGLVALRASDLDAEAMFLLAPVTDALEDYRDNLSGWQLEELEEYGLSRKYRPERSRKNTVFLEEDIVEKENVIQDNLLSNIGIPVLIAHGKEDSKVPIEDSRRAVQKLDNAELIEMEDDHYLNESVQELCEKAVEFFSGKIPISET